jgi:hypothetical protein
MEAHHVSQKDIETQGRNDDSQSAIRFSMVWLIFYTAIGDSVSLRPTIGPTQ